MPGSVELVAAGRRPSATTSRGADQARALLQRRVRAASALAGLRRPCASRAQPATTPRAGSACRVATSCARRWPRPPRCSPSAPAPGTRSRRRGPSTLPPESTTDPEVATTSSAATARPCRRAAAPARAGWVRWGLRQRVPAGRLRRRRRVLRHRALARPGLRPLRHDHGRAVRFPVLADPDPLSAEVMDAARRGR